MSTDKEVILNDGERLYVIPCKGGFSCYGYDVLFEKTAKLTKWINEHSNKTLIPTLLPPDESERGTATLYNRWLSYSQIARNKCEQEHLKCDIALTPQLIGLEGKRVEVKTQWETLRFYVGTSIGWMPCHLQIPRRNSSGGMAVYGAPFQSVRVIGHR